MRIDGSCLLPSHKSLLEMSMQCILRYNANYIAKQHAIRCRLQLQLANDDTAAAGWLSAETLM